MFWRNIWRNSVMDIIYGRNSVMDIMFWRNIWRNSVMDIIYVLA